MSKIDRTNRPNRNFTIKDYDPNWADQFAEYKNTLRQVLGDEAICIEHMGSTAVPGMAAKPQIDILVEARSLDSVRELYNEMKAAGFESLGDYTLIGEEFFRVKDADGHPLASVHVLPKGHPEIAFQIKFREYLKAHPKEVEDYSNLKKKLLRDHPGDYNAYGDAKRPYIDELRKRVDAWTQR